MLDQIIKFVFSIQLLALILILIGAYALLWWSIDNCKSIVQICRSFLVPYFQPQEDVPLSEKFGNWAGMMKKKLNTIKRETNGIYENRSKKAKRIEPKKGLFNTLIRSYVMHLFVRLFLKRIIQTAGIQRKCLILKDILTK